MSACCVAAVAKGAAQAQSSVSSDVSGAELRKQRLQRLYSELQGLDMDEL
jgi:hypothetical protein